MIKFPSTNEQDIICYMCKSKITKDLAQCPYCFTYFHKSELQKWIIRFGKCPRCERELKKFAK